MNILNPNGNPGIIVFECIEAAAWQFNGALAGFSMIVNRGGDLLRGIIDSYNE